MKRKKVLLTGNIGDWVFPLAETMRKDGDTVTVSGRDGYPKAEHYIKINGGSGDLSKLYRGGSFDSVVFFFCTNAIYHDETAREENLLGGVLDDLRLHLAQIERSRTVSHLIFVTDSRVFGTSQSQSENEEALPDTFIGNIIKTAEKQADNFCPENHSLKKLTVRVANLYKPGPADEFAENVFGSGVLRRSSPSLKCCEEDGLDFISCTDLGKFLALAIDYGSSGTMHLSGAGIYKPDDFRSFLERFGIEISLIKTEKRAEKLQGTRAHDELGFIPHGILQDDIYEPDPKNNGSGNRRLFETIRQKFGKAVPWTETMAGAAVMHLLETGASGNSVLSMIDFRLLYAVIIGSAHGTFFGWIAGFLAYASYCIERIMLGTDPWDLLLNLDNWIPFALYLTVGGITGYLKTSHDNRVRELSEYCERRDAELKYLQDVHTETCDMRDDLMDQVLNSRDSYGKIYFMMKELDSLFPDEIMFKAIGIFENVLSNSTVAIYQRNSGEAYLRKIVGSEETEDMSFSLKIADYPLLEKYLDQKELFTNKDFLPGYPSYAMTLGLSENEEVTVFIWKAKPNQYSKYYQNLFSIVSELAKISLEKAVSYQNRSERYIPGTMILKEDEFIKSWLVRKEMKQKNMGEYALLRVSVSLPDDVLSERLEGSVRSIDVVGKMNDGTRYIILMQARKENLPVVVARLASKGVAVNVAAEKELSGNVS